MGPPCKSHVPVWPLQRLQCHAFLNMPWEGPRAELCCGKGRAGSASAASLLTQLHVQELCLHAVGGVIELVWSCASARARGEPSRTMYGKGWQRVNGQPPEAVGMFNSCACMLQEALQRLWGHAFPGVPWEGVRAQRWRDMGWQRDDPRSDFRGGGFASLQNHLYMAKVRHQRA